MLAGFQGLPDQLIMLDSRCCDGYTFYLRVGQDFRNAGGRLHAIFFTSGIEHLRAYITHATQSA